jgi:phage-related protein
MYYGIVFYDDKNSDPITKFIVKCDNNLQAKIIHQLDLLEKYGLEIGMPHIKKISRQLFELRILGKVNVRLILAYKNETFYVLHIFKKKTNKIPSKELNMAINRLTKI